MFEHHSHPLLPRRLFLRRMLLFLAASVSMDALTIGIAAVGFHELEGMSWLDAALNGALILTGNGPFIVPTSAGGRLFTLLYAVGAGMVFVVVAGVLLLPVFHRLLHIFHLEVQDQLKED